MRILVTGGAGYIGSHAVRLFRQQGHQVWVYDNLSRGHRAAVPAECLLLGDLQDGARLDEALLHHRIEAIVHFAAYALVGESVRQPWLYYQNNILGSLQLLTVARRHGIRHFVFSSTCAVYGIPMVVPITEDAPTLPINPYGNTKLTVERALADYAAVCGWSVAILRYFNAAGAHPGGQLGEDHDPETHIIPLAIRAAVGGRPLELYGIDYPTPDGTCIRDYIHVDDLAEAHLRALSVVPTGQCRVFNLGTGKGHSVREVIQTIETVTGYKVPIREIARRPGDPPILVASAARAQHELGWEPRYRELGSIVETAWEWHRLHPEGYRK